MELKKKTEKDKTVLHICTYYIGNKLYKNLIKHLSLNKLNQEVFIPVRNKQHIGKNQLTKEYATVQYSYSNILKKYDKFFYFKKINRQTKEIEKLILQNGEINFIHAHTIFSDGGTAYNLFRKYGINYIVNVRNTDVNTFFKYGVHLRPFMYNILKNSSRIIFISHAYKKQLLSNLPSEITLEIESKCMVIPNGIDEYWHKNTSDSKNIGNIKKLNLLFIGELNKNKNFEAVIMAYKKLIKAGYDLSLHVIGSGPKEVDFRKQCETINKSKVIFHGYINDKSKMREIMDNSDIFIMPSLKETFGLVYIEAMSRGIPVIYTENQGIDGFFEEGEVGYSVEPRNIDMIVDSINKITNDYNQISQRCIINAKTFNWPEIAKKYLSLYR